MTKIFKIQVVWQVTGTLEIEADSLEDAIELAYEKDLPKRSEYVDDSFKIDKDSTNEFNPDGEPFQTLK
jgi:hypothetical protein